MNDERVTLSALQVQFLDTELEMRDLTILLEFCSKPRSIREYHHWKAAGHKVFRSFFSSIVMDGVIDLEYLTGMGWLSEKMEICFHDSVQRRDVELLQRLCVKFVKHYERS